jgi:5-methylcytosine-specific restriction enzyme A
MFRALQMMLFGHPADRQGRRASQWPAVRREFLLLNKTCAACGGRENLTPHHVKPFHLFPELELEPNNLIALCEGSVFNCHLFFGHLGNWGSYNEQVRRHAKLMLNARVVRPAFTLEDSMGMARDLVVQEFTRQIQEAFDPPKDFKFNGQTFEERCNAWARYAYDQIEQEIERVEDGDHGDLA